MTTKSNQQQFKITIMMQIQRDKLIPESTPHARHYRIKKYHNYFPMTAIFSTQTQLIYLPNTIKTHYHTEMQWKFQNLYKTNTKEKHSHAQVIERN